MVRPLLRGGARRWLVLAPIVASAVAGCGDDGGPAPQDQPADQRMPAGPAGGPPKTLLAVKRRIEDRVVCPVPDQPSDSKDGKCDPKAPSCGEHRYCLQLTQGSYCEPCPERDGIRHAFRERDFDPEHNRDPFQPRVGPGGPTAPPGGLTMKCPGEDQLVASSYSYAELKLVGIVAQGTQRKVLMTMGKDGYIIKRGDCVGKEKAVVKDIGLGYVTFLVDPKEYSVQLNPKQLVIDEPMLPAPRRRTMVAPPPVPPPRAPAAGSNAVPPVPAPAPTAPPAGTAPGAPPAPPPAEAPPAKKS